MRMHIYTIHEHPYGTVGAVRKLDLNLIFVREGFSWFAFFLLPIWALWHRLWLVAISLVFVSVLVTLIVVFAGFSAWFGGLLGFGLMLLVGFEANDLRRWTMKHRSWNLRGVVVGRGRDDAVLRYLSVIQVNQGGYIRPL